MRTSRRWHWLLAGVVIAVSAAADPQSANPVREFAPASALLDDTGFAGTIVVYDLARNTYTAGHAARVDRRLIPASTFKIFSSLVALETGVIDGPSAVIAWDGITRQRDEVNRDLDLQTAFRVSAVPHYQELVRRIGRDRMQQFVDRVGYGNRDLAGDVDSFWLTGALRISPREQVDLLVRLYRDDLPFSLWTMAMVKQMMVAEQTPGQVIRAKTGWATLPGDEHIGWWVGWVERASGVYVFATALEAAAADPAFGPARQGLTRAVLEQLGVLDSAR